MLDAGAVMQNDPDRTAVLAEPACQTAEAHPYQRALGWCLLVFAIPLLWWVTGPERQAVIAPLHLLFWHTAMEVFAVVVSLLVFVTGYRAILSPRNAAVVLLGVAYLGVGLLDFLHTMSYPGMPGTFPGNDHHETVFYWLAARVLAASALLVYAQLPSGSTVSVFKKRMAVLLMLLLLGGAAAVGSFPPDGVAAWLVAELTLPAWKTGLEWLTVAMNGATVAVLWRRRKALLNECGMALSFSAALSAVSQLFLTLPGLNGSDTADLLCHVYKVAAYLYLFHATFNEALRRPLERMEVQHLREKVALSAAPDGVLWVDQSGTILMVNPAMEVLTGYPPSELLGRNVDIFLPPHSRERHAQSMRGYFTAPRSREMGLLDLKLLRRDGRMLPVDIALGHWRDQGSNNAIAYIRDLTERKQFEESLRHKATHDQLTGLPNRWLFRLQLDQALARANRVDQRVAVLFLDLDNFKNVNDSFGHATGDALLVQVGVRMRAVLRESDTLARLGGDEFAILLSDVIEVDEAVSVGAKLLTSLQASYHLQDQDVYSGGSLGLAFYPDDARDSETLLRYADMAMYQSKQSGRGTYACFSPEMDRRVHEDLQMHTRLKEAITLGALQLHYQPQVDVRSGAIVGAEALLRWRDPVLGDVSPVRFIPLAEATGLVLPLTDWVLQAACTQIAAWAEAGMPLRVAVNFSAQQFRQRDLPEKICAALERAGAQAQWLEIEITESVAMAQPEQAREQLSALASLGCGVALDDFGTGYSSLAYLKALPVHKLKIDRSFMKEIPGDLDGVKISGAIIALAHSLGLTLVAEGVETAEQLAFLDSAGCEVYQGWLFAKAMNASAMTDLLKASFHGRLCETEA